MELGSWLNYAELLSRVLNLPGILYHSYPETDFYLLHIEHDCVLSFFSYGIPTSWNITRPFKKVSTFQLYRLRYILGFLCFHVIHSDEGLKLETSLFESFTVANLPY